MYKCKHCNEEFDNRYKLTGHSVHCQLNPDNTQTFVCEYCSTEIIGKHSYTQHKNHCNLNPNKKDYKYNVRAEHVNNPSNCRYCNKECKNDNSLRNHERFCKENPNKESLHLSNCGWSKGLSKDTDDRVKNCSNSLKEYYKTHENPFKHHEHSPEVLAKFNRYHSSKRGYYQGILFMSTWELAYYLYMIDNGHTIVRNEDWYEYEVEGIIHKYNPDFIIDNKYIVEVKGYKTEIDDIKWSVIDNLIIIDKDNINSYITYVKNKYQVEKLEDLYDRRIN